MLRADTWGEGALVDVKARVPTATPSRAARARMGPGYVPARRFRCTPVHTRGALVDVGAHRAVASIPRRALAGVAPYGIDAVRLLPMCRVTFINLSNIPDIVRSLSYTLYRSGQNLMTKSKVKKT